MFKPIVRSTGLAGMALALLLVGCAVRSDEWGHAGSRAESAGPRISDVAWIAGNWIKRDGKNLLQELWTEPTGDSMVGSFRWIKDGKVWIYELMTIREEGGTLVFRFRHFASDMTAWEPKTEPITYRLLSLGDREAVFENPNDAKHHRYELSRPDDKTLLVRVGAKREGKIAYNEFRYTRH